VLLAAQVYAVAACDADPGLQQVAATACGLLLQLQAAANGLCAQRAALGCRPYPPQLLGLANQATQARVPSQEEMRA
jgi:hypothetical protein